jgi:hypothetical protein
MSYGSYTSGKFYTNLLSLLFIYYTAYIFTQFQNPDNTAKSEKYYCQRS